MKKQKFSDAWDWVKQKKQKILRFGMEILNFRRRAACWYAFDGEMRLKRLYESQNKLRQKIDFCPIWIAINIIIRAMLMLYWCFLYVYGHDVRRNDPTGQKKI